MRINQASTRWLLSLGIIGPVLTVATFLIDGATRRGYDPYRNTVSQLSLGDRGWLGSANLIVGGLLILGFTIGLRRVMPRSLRGIWGTRLVALIGSSLLAVGLIKTDPSAGYPAGVTPTVSISGMLHSAAGLILFSALTAAFFVLTPRVSRDNPWRGTTAYGFIGGAVSGLASTASIVTILLSGHGFGPGYAGVLERIAIIVGYSGIPFLAWTYWRAPEQVAVTAEKRKFWPKLRRPYFIWS